MPESLTAEIAAIRAHLAALETALQTAQQTPTLDDDLAVLGEIRRQASTLARLVEAQQRLDRASGETESPGLAALHAALDALDDDGIGLSGKPLGKNDR